MSSLWFAAVLVRRRFDSPPFKQYKDLLRCHAIGSGLTLARLGHGGDVRGIHLRNAHIVLHCSSLKSGWVTATLIVGMYTM